MFIEKSAHIPVMLEHCLQELNLKKGSWYIDGTFGAGGHSKAMLTQGVKVLAIDQDTIVKKFALEIASKNFIFAQDNFCNLDNILKNIKIQPIMGILFDLGVSSMQLAEANRGFAFRLEGPLDMRMSTTTEASKSATDILNTYPQEKLATILFKYGEERYSHRIARAIVKARPVKTTSELVNIIIQAYPRKNRNYHPARRTFQALRIYINDELGALEKGLKASEKVLNKGGRLLVISYHSLEDRIVKKFMRQSLYLKAIYKKPLRPSEAEVAQNARARSAKLRVAEKLQSLENESTNL